MKTFGFVVVVPPRSHRERVACPFRELQRRIREHHGHARTRRFQSLDERM